MIILFYKNLIEVGGAERLLINAYFSFKELGQEVKIVSFKINERALFNYKVKKEDLLEIHSKNWMMNILKFSSFLKENRDAIVICDSGHIDMYLASIVSSTSYSLHLHHPLFMSFNDYDKYSIFLSKHFNKRTKSNFGANRFLAFRESLSIYKMMAINLRAFLSIKAMQKAKKTFVLSKYAQEEKKELFGIDSHVLCGAIDENIFDYSPKNKFNHYDKYDWVFLTVGRLDINKRIDILLDAFSILVNRKVNGILLVGGTGPEYDNLKLQAVNLGIEDRVEFLGFVPDDILFDYYARADLFVSIDWADYRITSYEAWAMGTKVLLSNEVKYDEFLQEKKYLFLSHPTASATAHKIEEIITEDHKVDLKEIKEYLYSFTWKNYNMSILKVLENEN